MKSAITKPVMELDKELRAEAEAYDLWERQTKNRILAMHDEKKKQAAWSRLFPTFTSNDEWMLTAEVF